MKNRGISLIALIITIIVTVILAAVMIPSGVDKINSAKLAAFNNDIILLKNEVDSYMALNNLEYPVKTDGSGNYIVYSANTNPNLLVQITKKDDQNDTFYILDSEKLKLDNKDIGIGTTVDDYYIIAKTSRNIYYAKGVKIGDIVHYTKENKGDGIVAVLPTSAATPTSTPTATSTPVAGATLTPTNTPIPTPTNTPIPTPTNTPIPTPTNTPIPTPTNTPIPTATKTPTPTATKTPTPTDTPTPAPIVLELSGVSVDDTLPGGGSANISGQVRGPADGRTIYVKYDYIDNISDYYGYPATEGSVQTITSNGIWQNFSGVSARLTNGYVYTICVWATDSAGNSTDYQVFYCDTN